MRILYVLAYYHPHIGGGELVFKRLAEELVQRGHDAKVITMRQSGAPRIEEIRGVTIQRVWVPRVGGQYAFSMASLPAIIGQARDYDLIHTSSYYSSLSAFLGARIVRRPVVLTCHEVLGKQWQLVRPHSLMSRVAKAVEMLEMSLHFDKYVAVSHATLDDMLEGGVSPTDAKVIYNGVDDFAEWKAHTRTGELRKDCGIEPDAFLYLYYGRPGITKGLDYLLKAVPQIQREIPDSHLILILASEPRENYLRLRSMIDGLQSACNIHLLPQVPPDARGQLLRYLLDADCIAVPSLTEGFGLTTAEACALNIPVVASRVGAIPEVVSGYHILVEPGSPSALSDGVVSAWSGEYDYLPPKEFSWARMVDEYESLYKALV